MQYLLTVFTKKEAISVFELITDDYQLSQKAFQFVLKHFGGTSHFGFNFKTLFSDEESEKLQKRYGAK